MKTAKEPIKELHSELFKIYQLFPMLAQIRQERNKQSFKNYLVMTVYAFKM